MFWVCMYLLIGLAFSLHMSLTAHHDEPSAHPPPSPLALFTSSALAWPLILAYAVLSAYRAWRKEQP